MPRRLLVLLSLLLTSPVLAADGPLERATNDRLIIEMLARIHDQGAALFNTGDHGGCYRMFQGALVTVKLVVPRELQEQIDRGIGRAELETTPTRRALALHELIETVRKKLHPTAGAGERLPPPKKVPADEEGLHIPGVPMPKPPEKKPDEKKPGEGDVGKSPIFAAPEAPRAPMPPGKLQFDPPPPVSGVPTSNAKMDRPPPLDIGPMKEALTVPPRPVEIVPAKPAIEIPPPPTTEEPPPADPPLVPAKPPVTIPPPPALPPTPRSDSPPLKPVPPPVSAPPLPAPPSGTDLIAPPPEKPK